MDDSNSDHQAYTSAANADTFEQGLFACSQISETSLSSECVAFQVRSHGRNHPQRAEDSCTALPEGIWRDECFFLLADAVSDPSAPAEASAICKQAGRYFQPCFMHLLKAHAGHLRAALPHGEAHAAYASAIGLAGSQAPHDFNHRAWSVFFRSAGGPDRVYDTRGCTELQSHVSDCISGVREALARRLNRSETPSELCAQADHTASNMKEFFAQSMGISIAPDPALNAVIRPFFKRHCAKPGHPR